MIYKMGKINFQPIITAEMQFKFDFISGEVLKAIENINAFHMQGTHLKELII